MTEATVIIAAWQAEAHLERSVNSALAQQDVDLDIIIVDDASPDGTAALADEMAMHDRRITVQRQEENGGPAAARNAGIDSAQGDWIVVLDADDAMTPGRLAGMIEVARKHGADAVYDNFQPVDETGRPTGLPHLPDAATGPEQWDLITFLAGNQARPDKPSLGYLKPLMSRTFLNAHGLRYDPGLRNGEDFHLMLAMLAHDARLWFTPEAGYLYTTRAGSISNRLAPDHAKALARADAAFLDRHKDRLGPEGVRLMRNRLERIADLAATEAAMYALRNFRPDQAAVELMRRPRAMGRFATQLRQALRRRLA